ncbi:MAG TPA: uracil-DNA glycosylase, partial [Cyanobacteria bacterium UBA11991]|nr:uracil-DNA glycosylase [Cyanobacteria bacterium UBA11991]
MTDFEQKLKPIYEKCLHCEKCSLCKSRTNIVFSAGV